jgi:hypothetical protein
MKIAEKKDWWILFWLLIGVLLTVLFNWKKQ